MKAGKKLSAVTVRRLTMLVERLRTVPKERFDLATWAGAREKPWRGDEDLSCGTTACAVGWATTIPSFRRAGLEMIPLPSCGVEDCTSHGEPIIGGLRYGQHNGLRAAAAFFRIDETLADHLFVDDSYDPDKRSKADVVRRIRAVLRRGTMVSP